jgi:hypothetical protein
MIQLETIRRVTIYADAPLEDMIASKIVELGALGYTVLHGKGRGKHPTLDDPFADHNRTRIELLARPETADRIMQYLSGPNFRNRAVAACVETVEVTPGHGY